MDEAEIRRRVAALDTADPAEARRAWEELRALGVAVVPHLAEFFPRARKWQGRAALVFHAIRHARDSDHAFRLGLMALRDKSHMVRFRGCGLLAYALRKDALPALQELLGHSDRRTVEDATAAIDAIRSRNHNFFVDRGHTGRLTWTMSEDAGQG
jgi:integrase